MLYDRCDGMVYGDYYYNVNFSLSSDGPGEKRRTSIVWSPRLVLFLTQTTAASTGPSSGPWRGCTRRLTRACRNTYVLLPPCAEGCVACHPKREVRNLPAYSRLNTLMHMQANCQSMYTPEVKRSGPCLFFEFEQSRYIWHPAMIITGNDSG